MNRQLINIEDIRKYRQLGKQTNQTDIEGKVREVQENQLTELLCPALMYDFCNFLDNGYTSYGGAVVRDSTTQLTLSNFDASTWLDYSLKINDTVFCIVVSSVFDGTDTVITVTGYDLPETITIIGYSVENKYINLLNGTTYTYDKNTIIFKGIRPFLVWHFVVCFLTTGTLKQNDIGNFNIESDLISRPSGAQINSARSSWLQNASREENHIKQYLNTKNSTYPLWVYQPQESIINFDWQVH